MTDTRLKNCPFCGGEAKPPEEQTAGYWVECTECKSRGSRCFFEIAAIAAWNRRASPPAAVPDVSKTVKQRAWEIADQLWLDTNEKSKLARLICDAFSASPTPPVDDGWRPIETAPKDGTQIILLSANGTRQIGWWSEAASAWAYGGGSWGENITHWRPLPPPPQGQE